jgi:MFS family permease
LRHPGRIAHRSPARAAIAPAGRELFAPGLRRQTLTLAAMAGLNFFGYAAFSGWLTTYLTGERGFSAQTAGALVAWQFSGNIAGGFFWGWAADRFGRRFNAMGFLIASARSRSICWRRRTRRC